jgi:hypothetical protein
MTLRHIDPGSTDWMDAMLEGEPATLRKRQADLEKIEPDASILTAADVFSGEPAGSPPHPPR